MRASTKPRDSRLAERHGVSMSLQETAQKPDRRALRIIKQATEAPWRDGSFQEEDTGAFCHQGYIEKTIAEGETLLRQAAVTKNISATTWGDTATGRVLTFYLKRADGEDRDVTGYVALDQDIGRVRVRVRVAGDKPLHERVSDVARAVISGHHREQNANAAGRRPCILTYADCTTRELR